MKQLIFVYNAEGGLFNSMSDFAHKIISPLTYRCNLCALTYGNFIMKNEWKLFIESLDIETAFLHKNEFIKLYHLQTNLPAVFIKENNAISQLISKEEIDSCATLQRLKNLVPSKLALHDQHHHSNI